jgi:hypothetical protein
MIAGLRGATAGTGGRLKLDQMNVELRRDVTAGKAIENAVAAIGAAFADHHFRQRRVGPAGENRDRGT